MKPTNLIFPILALATNLGLAQTYTDAQRKEDSIHTANFVNTKYDSKLNFTMISLKRN